MQVQVNGLPMYAACAPINEWTQVELDLLPWSNEQVEVAFYFRKKFGTSGTDTYWVDDIQVVAICP